MPRRNHNAQPIYRPKEFFVRPPMLDMPGCRICNPSRVKVTGESIVREFRRENRNNDQLSVISNQSSVKSNPTFQPYRVIPQAHPSFIRRIFDRINLGRAFNLTCAALAAIAIAYIFAFIVFGPFMLKFIFHE